MVSNQENKNKTDTESQYLESQESIVKSRNKKMAIIIVSIVFFMIALSYAAFPLYDLFCRVTGYGGTPKQVDTESLIVGERNFTVRFNSDISKELQWEFKPMQKDIDVKTGENKLIFYEAYNPTDEAITGVATFNVTPEKAAYHFSKVHCFCFEEQTLQPGQKVEMPVSFYIDPEIENDEEVGNLKTITLSYTFFKSKNK